MTITVNWIDPAQTALHLRFAPGWTWESLKAAVQQADHHITSVPHTVHLVIDIREAGGLPRDFMSAAGELFAQGDARANEGRRVVVGAGSLLRAAYGGLLRVYGHKLQGRPFEFAPSIEDARALLVDSF